MIRWLVILVMFAAPLLAGYESNFGKVILAKSDVIVLAVASAKRTKIRAGERMELTVAETLYGNKVPNTVSLFTNSPNLLKRGEAVRALFALSKMSGGGFKLVGKPVLTPDGAAESDEKIEVAKEYIAMEKLAPGAERTKVFWSMLFRCVRSGGYSAEDAAIELLYVAKNSPQAITQERFESAIDAEAAAVGKLTKQAQADLKLARKGMVEVRIKDLRYKAIRRGKTKQDKRTAAGTLLDLIEEYPRAFDKSDLEMIEAMTTSSDDKILKGKLKECRGELAKILATRK